MSFLYYWYNHCTLPSLKWYNSPACTGLYSIKDNYTVTTTIRSISGLWKWLIRASVCVPGCSLVEMDCSQAHPLSLDKREAHLQSRHISLSSHPLSVVHSFSDKHSSPTLRRDTWSRAHVATGLWSLVLLKHRVKSEQPKSEPFLEMTSQMTF